MKGTASLLLAFVELGSADLIQMASGDSSSQNSDEAREVDPNRLIERDGCLGFEKSSGFETVTNFIVSVGGYVVDSDVTDDVPMGYILMVEMEAFGEQPAHNNFK